MRKIFDLIKSLGGHYLLLELAVLISFWGFTLNPGSLGEFMRICGAIFIFNLFVGNYRLKQLTWAHVLLLTIFITLVVINFFMPAEMVHRRSLRYFLAFPWIILAMHCLFVRRKEADIKLPAAVYSASICLSVIFQYLAYQFIPTNEPWGMYGNQHHLGYFVCLTLPVLWYFLTESKGWFRHFLVLVLFIDMYLLWESSSRVAWFSFATALILTLTLYFKPRQILIGIAGFAVLAIVGAFLSGLPAIQDRVIDLLINWRTEERMVIWQDTIRLLGDNSTYDWLLGHGIGSFRYGFKEYSTFYSRSEILNPFPHNTPLQLVYENGLIGLLMIFGSLGLLIIALRRGYHAHRDQNIRNLIIISSNLLWVNLVYCGLTYSFYEKYNLYPLSLICGITLILLEKSNQIKPLYAGRLFKQYHHLRFGPS